MDRFFDENLNQLRTNLNKMAELAVHNVEMAIRSLVTRDLDLAKVTIRADEEIDELNRWVDQHVVEHITLCSPVATDVRLLYTTIKGSRDLERAGDEACTIAKRSKKIIRSGYAGDLFNVQELSELAIRQVNEALSCFLKGDLEMARAIPAKDKEIDKLYKSIDKQINKHIKNADFDPKDGPALIDLLFISKSLERVGDHAVNIAMEVIYFITGDDSSFTEDLKNL